ncbi:MULTISPECIES: YhgE/Pip domain-containing protein [Oceanobacillus]|uniref:YhgE/Pip domain-containing protein n=1 Tax=Oceanobacillus aidingensis TaxID=645964 RepID=A0ABV9JTU8_9BACI|nr:YhgE/Pip domain-containing protein [Oceanobacillus oncorhynchi]MDM8101112.1 YhgE/Pip domain-containing protein [Oceanobacillus oncorhynchi]UUI40748.1 YhgE/Pip domain-containing protein [Oceanobacillus oncorhynchi]
MRTTIKWIWLALALFFIPFMNTALAEGASEDSASEGDAEIEEKNEVIYANLEAGGALENIYVVNAFELNKSGVIEDFGNYESIKNLTDTSEIEQDGDTIRMDAASDTFYYQGDLSKELPWKFTISYYLDGEEVDPQTVIGESGQVEIEIKVEENAETETAFFDNYMLQISQALNTDYFYNIEAEDATIANAGKNRQVAFTVMPGEEETLTIQADTDQFELEGMEISGLPSSVSVDGPDTDALTEEFQSLTDAIGEINQGVGELGDGISGLSGGLSELENGSSEFQNGLNELNNSSGELTGASEEINNAFQTVQEEVGQITGIDGIEQLSGMTEAASDMAAGMEALADELDSLSTGYGDAKEALQTAMEGIPEATLTEEDFQALYDSEAVDPAVVDELVGTYEAAQGALAVYYESVESFDAVEPALSEFQTSASDIASNIRTFSDELEQSVGQIDIDEGLDEFITSVDTMAENYNQFHEGLVSYTNGVNELSTSYADIHNGISESASGSNELANGADELQDGTSELYDATESIPDEMQEEIDEMISQYDKSDFDPVSFVSEENDEITNSVQFVIQTDSIQPEEDTEETEEEEENEGFWDRLLNLF